MKLFLDTEFTQLLPNNKLISIAVVDENEEFFYAELTDTYELKDCSDFVIETVLPLLEGGEYRMTRLECANRLGNWIEDHPMACVMACDNPSWDMPHLFSLLLPCWPANLIKELTYPVFVPSDVEEQLVETHKLHIHHALTDARIMKWAEDKRNRGLKK